MKLQKIAKHEARAGDLVIEFYPFDATDTMHAIATYGLPNLPPGPFGRRGYRLRIEQEE